MRFRLLRAHALRIGGVSQLCPAGMVVELPLHTTVTPFMQGLDADAQEAVEASKYIIRESTADTPQVPAVGSRQLLYRPGPVE